MWADATEPPPVKLKFIFRGMMYLKANLDQFPLDQNCCVYNMTRTGPWEMDPTQVPPKGIKGVWRQVAEMV